MAGESVQTVTSPVQVQQLVDRNVRIADASGRFTCTIIGVEELPRSHGAVHPGVRFL